MTSYFTEPADLSVSSRMALKAEITFDSEVVEFGFLLDKPTEMRINDLLYYIIHSKSRTVFHFIEYKNIIEKYILVIKYNFLER